MYPRHLAPRIKRALKDTPAIILCGARQTGKSTLTQALIGKSYDANYLTFDDVTLLAAAKEDPAGFISGLKYPVILDEVQKAPEIFPSIKRAIDQDRKPGRFLLTGSANVLFLPRLSESLAGRVELFTLWPLSIQEILRRKSDVVSRLFDGQIPRKLEALSRAELTKLLVRGNYPTALKRAGDRRGEWFLSYMTTILQRDIRDLADIEGLTKLPRLFALLASRSASLLNLSDVSNAVDIPYATLHRYMALLEATFLLVMIPPWSSNLGLRLVKGPKVLINDTGLLCAVLGVDEKRFARDPNILGGALETFVGMELKKLIGQSNSQVELFHFRTHSREEVDYLLERRDGQVVGVEVKARATVTADDFGPLKQLAGKLQNKFSLGIVLYSGDATVPFGERLFAVPLSVLWS